MKMLYEMWSEYLLSVESLRGRFIHDSSQTAFIDLPKHDTLIVSSLCSCFNIKKRRPIEI